MPELIPPAHIARLSGFGMSKYADGYLFQPRDLEGVWHVFGLARKSGHQVVLRGAARSYGDAAIGAECLVLDCSRFNKVIEWDPNTGIIDLEPGVTLAEIWQKTLPDGWWLPVVSGTTKTSIGGALAMNIHGKNNWTRGVLGEHVLEIGLFTPGGELLTLRPTDALFSAVIGGLGLLGVIVRVKLQMKDVKSGDLKVYATSCKNWEDQFRQFERFEGHAEYVVSWIDAFARGSKAGRGILHAATHEDVLTVNKPTSLQVSHQQLPPKIAGFFPKSSVWKILKLLNNRPGMKLVNGAKFRVNKIFESGKTYRQSLAAFNFLLDYVPGWEKAYLPGGLIQCQFFAPKDQALPLFKELTRLQQEAKLESFLAVMKRHREDRFLISHGVDGYSLALDFKVTSKNRKKLIALAQQMQEAALKAGARFYFAKDSTLTPQQAHRFLGESLESFRALKKELDPEGLLTSELARRLQLTNF